MGGPGAPGTEDTGDFSDGEGDLAANTAAQAAARAAFAEDKAADTFYSSDEDESEDKSSVTGSFVSGSAGSTTEASKKFKVVIKVSNVVYIATEKHNKPTNIVLAPSQKDPQKFKAIMVSMVVSGELLGAKKKGGVYLLS